MSRFRLQKLEIVSFFCMRMKLYPESATAQLEFDKIKNLLHEKCQSQYARDKALDYVYIPKKNLLIEI